MSKIRDGIKWIVCRECKVSTCDVSSEDATCEVIDALCALFADELEDLKQPSINDIAAFKLNNIIDAKIKELRGGK